MKWSVQVPAATLGPFDTEAEAAAAYCQHVIAAVSEGMCPHCARRLSSLRACLLCQARWTVTATGWAWEALVVP